MEQLIMLQREDIERQLKPQAVRTIQVIQVALVMGTVIFFVICMVLYEMSAGPAAGGSDIEILMLPVLGLMFLGALVAAAAVSGAILRPDALARRAQAISGDPLDWATAIHRQVVIIRLAMFESAALFGLVILMLAIMGGRLAENPILWLAILPLLFHVAYGVLSFPSRHAVVEFIETRIIGPLRQKAL